MDTEHVKSVDEMDERLRVAVREFVNSLPADGQEEGWRCIEQKLYSGSNRRVAPRDPMRTLIMCLAAFAALTMLFQIPVVHAWSVRMIIKYEMKLPGRIRTFITTIAPEVRANLASRNRVVGSDELSAEFGKLAFTPMVPKTDANWCLEAVKVKPWGSEGFYVTLTYKDEEGDTLRLAEVPLAKSHSTSIFYNQDHSSLSRYSIRGADVAVLSHDTGSIIAWWYEQGLSLSLTYTGNVDKAISFITNLAPYEKGSP